MNEPTPSLKGRKNIYTCRKCLGHIVTVDRDAGTTPFQLGCLASPGCSGMMHSSMYRVFDQTMGATHEWFRPDDLSKYSPMVQEHIKLGGLVIHPIKDAAVGALQFSYVEIKTAIIAALETLDPSGPYPEDVAEVTAKAAAQFIGERITQARQVRS